MSRFTRKLATAAALAMLAAVPAARAGDGRDAVRDARSDFNAADAQLDRSAWRADSSYWDVDRAERRHADAVGRLNAAIDAARAQQQALRDAEDAIGRVETDAALRLQDVNRTRAAYDEAQQRLASLSGDVDARRSAAMDAFFKSEEFQRLHAPVDEAGGQYNQAIDQVLSCVHATEPFITRESAAMKARQEMESLQSAPITFEQQRRLAAASAEWLSLVGEIDQIERTAIEADPAVQQTRQALDAAIAREQQAVAQVERDLALAPAIRAAIDARAAAQGEVERLSSALAHAQGIYAGAQDELNRLYAVVNGSRDALTRIDFDITRLQAEADDAARDARAARYALDRYENDAAFAHEERREAAGRLRRLIEDDDRAEQARGRLRQAEEESRQRDEADRQAREGRRQADRRQSDEEAARAEAERRQRQREAQFEEDAREQREREQRRDEDRAQPAGGQDPQARQRRQQEEERAAARRAREAEQEKQAADTARRAQEERERTAQQERDRQARADEAAREAQRQREADRAQQAQQRQAEAQKQQEQRQRDEQRQSDEQRQRDEQRRQAQERERRRQDDASRSDRSEDRGERYHRK